MRIVIFAGGVGSRLWPLSRKNTPKQFGKIIGDQSTLQQAISRLQPAFAPKDIFVATGLRYKDIVMKQLPELPAENFIFEPEMRDVGPAIGLVSILLEKIDPNEPIAIIWSDHLVRNVKTFQTVLKLAETTVKEKQADFIFIGQKPRFANQNIGWIQCGEKIETKEKISLYKFNKLKYRPKLSQAEDFFEDKNYVWNLGYFVTTPAFLTSMYKTYASEMYEKLSQIRNSRDTADYEETLSKVYPTIEKISFDDAILEKLNTRNIYVISEDLGWSDIGAWEALKEALARSDDENVVRGNVLVENSVDSLIFNYNKAQLVVGIDMDKMVIVNTNDVLLICPKDSVPKIKELVKNLEGTDHEHLA